jgi:hypothetical protein
MSGSSCTVTLWSSPFACVLPGTLNLQFPEGILRTIQFSEIIQIQKDRYCMLSFIRRK